MRIAWPLAWTMCVILIVIGIAMWTFGATGEIETESPARLLERMANAYERLERLEASLTQTASFPQLGITDPPEEGFLQVEKHGDGVNVRLELTRPERRILVVKDGSYVFYQPRIKQAIVGDAGSEAESAGARSHAGRSLMILLGDVSEVEDDFEVELINPRARLGERQTAHLRLVPKDPSKSFYQRIDIWVDEEVGLPVSQLLVEPNGDEMRIELDSIRVNDPSQSFDFDLELPKDVERIRGGA